MARPDLILVAQGYAARTPDRVGDGAPPPSGFNGAGSGTTSATPNTSSQALAARSARGEAPLTNTSDNAVIYIAVNAAAVVGSGKALYPGDTFDHDYDPRVLNVASSVASVPYAFLDL